MSTSLPQRTPAPPPAAMLPPAPAPAPEPSAIDGALVLATLAAPSAPTEGMSTPELNARLECLGFGSNPLSVLGRILEGLYVDGLVGRYRPPNYRAEAGHRVCAQRRYWVTDEGRVWLRVDEEAAR